MPVRQSRQLMRPKRPQRIRIGDNPRRILTGENDDCRCRTDAQGREGSAGHRAHAKPPATQSRRRAGADAPRRCCRRTRGRSPGLVGPAQGGPGGARARLCWFGIADLEARRGNQAEADTCYRRAGYLLQSESAVAYNHGVLLEAMGRTDEAIDAYREAIIRRNDFAQAHNNVGTLLLAKGETELAARHFDAALRADPGLARQRSTWA